MCCNVFKFPSAHYTTIRCVCVRLAAVRTGSIVTVDEWKGYRPIDIAASDWEYRSVCHEHEFVNKDGDHTNPDISFAPPNIAIKLDKGECCIVDNRIGGTLRSQATLMGRTSSRMICTSLLSSWFAAFLLHVRGYG